MNKQQIEAILNDAPEGASQYSKQSCSYYKYIEGEFRYYDHDYCQWMKVKYGVDKDTHALAGLRRELELIERVERLENLQKMLLDSESADPSLIPIMYHTWLNAAKELLGDEDGLTIATNGKNALTIGDENE